MIAVSMGMHCRPKVVADVQWTTRSVDVHAKDIPLATHGNGRKSPCFDGLRDFFFFQSQISID